MGMLSNFTVHSITLVLHPYPAQTEVMPQINFSKYNIYRFHSPLLISGCMSVIHAYLYR